MLDSVGVLGGRSIRLDIPWQAVEWGRNRWEFAGFDYIVHAAAARGISVDLILDYNNPIYGGVWNEIPHDLAAWDRYVATVVGRYKGRVGSYEVWNEADMPDFNRNFAHPATYLALLRRTYRVVKSSDRRALVAMTSLSRESRSNPSFWPQIAAAANPYFDIANIHVYSGTVAERTRYIRRLSPGKQVWATEVGFPADNEARQAAFLQRTIPSLRAAGVETIYVFSWRDNLTKLTNRRFGLLRSNNTLRPAARVFQNFSGNLSNARLGR